MKIIERFRLLYYGYVVYAIKYGKGKEGISLR